MNATLHDSQADPIIETREATIEVPVVAAKPTAKHTPGFWVGLGLTVVWILVCRDLPVTIFAAYAAINEQLITAYIPAAMITGQLLGTILAIVLLSRKMGWRWVPELGLNRLPAAHTVLAVISVPGVWLVLTCISVLMSTMINGNEVGKLMAQTATSSPWWVLMLMIAVGPAINEELWFRGYLGRGLVGRFGPFVGILITSLLFGVMHFDPIQSCYAVVLGVWLHLVYRWSRSLWIPILAHCQMNAVSTGFMMLAMNGLVPGDSVLLAIGSMMLVVMVAGTWAMYLLRAKAIDA